MKHSNDQYKQTLPSAGQYGGQGEKPWHDRECAADQDETREYNNLDNPGGDHDADDR